MFQRIGRPEDRERDGEATGQWSSQNTHSIYQLYVPSYVSTVPRNNDSTNNKDHSSQITIINIIIIKKFEILQEISTCDTETQSEQMLLEKW